MTGSPSVTVAILTYNGQDYLAQILDRLQEQDYPGRVEVLVIDSGSTDSTLEIVARHPEVNLHTIPNSEFGHGRTRDLAARLASGEFVAYLTHDAVPMGNGWLSALVAPMIDDERIAAVMGKQEPRPWCYPLLKYEIMGVFTGLGPDFGVTVFRDDGTLVSKGLRDAAGFYSDVNSAARRSILAGPVPYRDVPYAEDQFFGRDLIDKGYRKAYAPRASVQHSNDLSLSESGARAIDEVVGLRQVGTVIPELSRVSVLRLAVRGALLDTPRILRDPDYSAITKLRWLFANPVFHWVKWTSYRAATRLPVEVVAS